MKSFVFAALFAAVLAVPTKYDMSDPCLCKPAVICPQSFPASCECRAKALQECTESLPKHCPRPKLDFSKCRPKGVLGQACGGKDSHDNECGQFVCSYEDAPFPVDPEAKGKCVKSTQTLKQKCEGRGLKNCPSGYECYHEVDPKKVADIPGICVRKGFKPTSSAVTVKPTVTPVTALPGSSTVPTITSSHTLPSVAPSMCGGIAGIMCPPGFKCKYSDMNPFQADKSGYCFPESGTSSKVTSAPTATATPEKSECGPGKSCPIGQACKASVSVEPKSKIPAPDRVKNVCVPIYPISSPSSSVLTTMKTKVPEPTPVVPHPY